MIHGIIAGGILAAPPAFVSGGALAHKTSSQVYGAGSILTWETEDYDNANWHDNVTNTARFTVPSGVSLIRFGGNGKASGSSSRTNTSHNKNGASFFGRGWNQANPNTGLGALNAWSAPTAVSPGDYFEMGISISGTHSASTEDYSWASIEELDPALKYALVGKTANQALAGGTPTAMAWASETADTNGFHDNATNNSRLTVPSGLTLVRLSGNLFESGGSNILAEITKNGATARGLPARQQASSAADPINLVSAPIVVTPGDFFEMLVTLSGATSINQSDASWFAIEEVPSIYKRALVYKTADQSIAAATPTALTWNAEEYDTDAMHDNATNNSRLTVPSGVSQARLSYSLRSNNISNNFSAYATKNGGAFHGTPRLASNVASPGGAICAFGAWVDVTLGDYFELICDTTSARDVLAHNETWFCMECR